MWKKIVEHNNYSVSDDGLVRNDKTGKVLKQIPTYNGYLRVGLNKKLYRVHILVANAFVKNPNDYPQINHKDGNKQNNNASNLEWCTASQNIRHAHNIGLKKINYNGIKKPMPVEQLTLDEKSIKVFNCIMDVQRELGFDNSTISKACKGKYKTAYGYKWRYAIL